ncbi:leucine-rich repeat neuronal protein 1-like [Uranotaenia lowii]|uniref:leucine-rich repeat neuronal protein 1-like n=1 Tax=Uranotaenia lowii TaxID=190385 RepID=UPI00247A96DE|nr:leucine-rich repeat neuronal protein 1-like [Uranotaenia lowii]
MKVRQWRFVMLVVAMASLIEAKKYSCVPSGNEVCQMHSVFYDPEKSHNHEFPGNQTHVRIGTAGWSRSIESVVRTFDLQLYKQLGQPVSVEIINAGMKELIIPAKIRHGNFDDNHLTSFALEATADSPNIIYLDLSRNAIVDIKNVSNMVNLETLVLVSNQILNLDDNPLVNLKKLKHLYLNHNELTSISGEHFPNSLITLGLYSNHIKTIRGDLELPSLESLNLEHNMLSEINPSKMVESMPKVYEILIHSNRFPHDKVPEYAKAFKRLNITVSSDADDASCYYNNVEIEGICVQEGNDSGRSWFKATLLTVLTIVLGIVFVLALVWIYRAMNE